MPDFAFRLLHFQEVLFPRVAVIVRRDRYGLAVVADTSASDRKNQVNAVFTCELCALDELDVRGVSHDSGKFGDVFAGVLENLDDFVIQAGFLD